MRQGWKGRETEEERDRKSKWLDERAWWAMSAPHSSSINLVFLPLLWCFPQHQGNNDTLIHYPFIPVIHWELLNNMLQICPPSYNSFCHLQYIIWKTHSPLSDGRFEDYHGWHLRDAARIWCIIFFPGIKLNYTDLSVIAKSTTSHSGPKQRWNRFLSAPLNERACKFMLMKAFCHPGSPLGAERGLQGMIIWLLSALDNLYFILM